MSARPNPDEYGQNQYFSVTLDGDPLKEESHFTECTGLDITLDVTEYCEGGSLTPVKLPGPPRYSNIILRRGATCSKAFVEWVSKAAGREVTRMGGKIALCQRDGTPIMEWTFEKGWPCRYEGPRLNSTRGGLALESVEICHEGLKLQG